MSNLDAVVSELKNERDKVNQVIAALESVSSNGSKSRTEEARYLSSGPSPDCGRTEKAMDPLQSKEEMTYRAPILGSESGTHLLS
jgi:hypothetical protein